MTRRGLPDGSPVRRFGVILLLLVVVVADVLLVMTALARTSETPQLASTPPATLSPVTADPTPSPEPVEEEPVAEEDEPEGAAAAVPARGFISPLTATTAWRTSAEACPGGKVVAQYTEDGGETWETHDVSAATGAAQALRIEAVDADYTFLVTLDEANCGPQFSATYTGGQAWEAYTDERLLGSWFVRPDAPDAVVSPTGRQAAPCSVVALAARSEVEAAVVCTDHRVFRTVDAAASWDGGLDVTGAVNLDDTADGYVVAATGDEDCDGIRVHSIAAAASDEDIDSRGCVDVVAKPGGVAIGAADGAVWLWASGQVTRSLDGGDTWQ